MASSTMTTSRTALPRQQCLLQNLQKIKLLDYCRRDQKAIQAGMTCGMTKQRIQEKNPSRRAATLVSTSDQLGEGETSQDPPSPAKAAEEPGTNNQAVSGETAKSDVNSG